MSERRRPHGLGALLVIAIGAWLFFQIAVGDLVGRLQSWLPEDSGGKEPDGAGTKGIAFSASGRALARQFIKTMKTKLGATYVWGGDTPREGGFDCSGIGYWAAHKLGLTNIPRVSSAQIAHCRPLSVKKALRTTGACLYQPGHIAYAIGNGRDVLEASGSRDQVVVQDGRGRFTQGGIFPEFIGHAGGAGATIAGAISDVAGTVKKPPRSRRRRSPLRHQGQRV